MKGGATFIWKRKALTPKGTKAFLHFQNSRLTDSTRSISFIDSLSATTKSKLTDFTSSIESINFPSGLYTSGDIVIMRQEGVGFLIMEETHHNWVELRRYDETGLLTEVTYERA